MAQFHHVVFYDTATETWHVDPQTDAYMPDGEVWDYAGDNEWRGVPDAEEAFYQAQVSMILAALNTFEYDN